MSAPDRIGASEEPDLGSDDPLELDAAALSGERQLEGVALVPVALDDADLRGIRIADVSAERLSATGGDWRGASLLRVELREARLTGLDLGEARLREVRLRGCKLDYANLRHAELEYVSFKDCVLGGAVVDSLQLIDLAPQLAAELGIRVEER